MKFEDFFLVLAEVDGENTHAVYLKKPFREPPGFAAQGVIYSLAELKEDAERTYLRKIYYADRGDAEMDKREALILAKQYASIVSQELNPDRIILYGSHAKGTATEESDIDVAVIFNNFDGDWFRAYAQLSRLRRSVSLYIEPVLLDSANDSSGFVDEVLATGEMLYPQ